MPRRSADADGPPTDAPDKTKPAPTAKAKPRRKGSAVPRTGVVDHVHVADDALATIIGLAAHEVPGVVGMAPASLSEGLRRILGVSQVDEGVDIERSDDGASARVGLHVVVAYGVNIPAVAESVVQRVIYAARTFAGVKVADVKVHVAGVSRG
ncbi:MAG: Asp23/Gls24 family envelope stress response protein [Trueperaceae bacterium]|nr:Asp23/Gls24 family envelope stress response protein [Trueperaceae bacterium]